MTLGKKYQLGLKQVLKQLAEMDFNGDGFVEASEEEAGCLLVLAHNPGVHALAGDYLSESAASPAILDRLAGGFPTGAAALFTVDAAGRCTYEGFLTPRTLGGAA